jgi:hypothetical protein
MRSRCFAILFAIFLYSQQGTSINAQTTATPQPQASTLLAQSAAALTGSVAVSDVTLTGNAQSIAGSDHESGTVTLAAMAAGESRMDLSLSGGNRSQIRSFDANGNTVGAWSGSDGVQHPISFHNLLTDAAWFFPALTLNRIASNSAMVGKYVGQEVLNGQSVLHVSVSQTPTVATAPDAAIMQHLTQMNFYFDPTTLLPVALSFSTHPDGTELLDISVQIQFSNYQSISGVQVPMHVQEFVNGTLSLDLQLQSATLNSGLSATQFTVQVTP